MITAIAALLFVHCKKVEPCEGTQSTCFWTSYNSCVVCVKSPSDSTLVLLSYGGGTEHYEMSSCDTTAWLAEYRETVRSRNTEGDEYWLFFKGLYPDSCGCN
jgi:hypothetical protein